METLTDLEAQFEDIIKMNLSEADVDAVNVAASLVAKLRLSEISRSIMMKDMLDAYRAHGEVYKRTNYRHKLYIKLLFCYLYYRKITGNYGSFINIDEAQDISVCEYRLIRLVLGNRCVFNLYGDVNQLVYEYKGISDWDDISSEISGTVFTLNENYRNTLQITNFCNKEFGAEVYPIGVSGKDVREQSLSEAISWILDEKRTTPELRAAIIFRYGHIGISDALHQMTEGRDVSWYEIDEDKVSILSVESAKGLEFDIIVAVVDGMTFNEKYISYTRALENLVVVRDHFEYTKAADPIIDEVTLDDEVLADESNDSEIRITVSPVEVSVSQSNPIVNETEQTVIPQIALKNSDTELISAISGIIKEAFGDDQELSDEQCQIVHLLGRKTKLACTAPAGWKKSIILFALAKYAHENYGMQSILTAEGHLQENELVLAEKLGLKAGSISENMTGFLTDFKKEKYDIVFVPYDFFAYEANINEFVQYFSGKVSYWGIDHPSEEVILWTQIKKTIEALIATPFLMSKNGFDGVDLSGFEIANIIDDSEPIKDLVHTVSFADIEDKKTWVGEHAAAELWGQGIVYCDTEEQCKEISKLLRKRKIKAEAYTNVSDPNNAERINYLSNSFSKGGLPVLVTTHDAGKNLSNPNIRFIMHYSVPKDADLYTLHISQIGKLSEEPIVYDLRP